MATNKYYSEAISEIKAARKAALALYEQKKNEVYDKEPLLRELDLRLNSIGANLAITALSGNTIKLEQLKAQSLEISEKKQALIKKAGLSEPEFNCPVCEDTGFIKGKFCDCVKQRATAIIARELSSELPLENSTFRDFDLGFYPETAEKGVSPRKRMEQILKDLKAYAKNFGKDSKNMIFTGGAGLGKTHLSLAIVGEVLKEGFDAIYSPAQRLFDAIEKEHFSYSGTEEQLDAVLNCDLLVIDDLGTEFITPFTASVIHNIIDTRLLRKKPTIITTNLSPVELEKKYDPRIVSRLIGNYDFKVFTGIDIRQQKVMA